LSEGRRERERETEMKKMTQALTAALMARNVVAVVECYAGEGWKVTVDTVAATFAAEDVAREFGAKFGIDVVVAL
jgi:hypothetical protein